MFNDFLANKLSISQQTTLRVNLAPLFAQSALAKITECTEQTD